MTLSNYSKDMFKRNFDVLIKWKKSCEVKPTIRILMKAMQASDPRGLGIEAHSKTNIKTSKSFSEGGFAPEPLKRIWPLAHMGP
jgi:hypothetical protein